MIDDPLGIYVHWPFCRSKCPYCDFNSHAAASIDQPRWLAAIRRALIAASKVTPLRSVGSLFFGGGTPSLMDPDVVAGVIETVRAHWRVRGDWEVTLEANPVSADVDRFAGFAAAGVNRLSIGVQALDDATLRFLGRTHDAAQARRAVAIAIDTFPSVSIDLMFGWQAHEIRAWQETLDAALAFGTDHLSLYQLTIEDGTPFAAWNVRTRGADGSADLYERALDRLAAAGHEAYEISNFSRPGARCAHNVAIWRGGDYVGIGPGAHGRIRRGGTWLATVQTSSPADWLTGIEKGTGVEERTPLSARERAVELLLTGLRLEDGVDRTRFRERCGLAIEDVTDRQATETLVNAGLLDPDHGRLRATSAGRLILDIVIADLVA